MKKKNLDMQVQNKVDFGGWDRFTPEQFIQKIEELIEDHMVRVRKLKQDLKVAKRYKELRDMGKAQKKQMELFNDKT